MRRLVLAAVCALLPVFGGCSGGDSPSDSAQLRRPAELGSVQEVLQTPDGGPPRIAGYVKRWRRQVSLDRELYWVCIHDVRDEQVGLVGESGTTHRWEPGNGATSGKWVPLGDLILDDAIARTLGLRKGFRLSLVAGRGTGS